MPFTDLLSSLMRCTLSCELRSAVVLVPGVALLTGLLLGANSALKRSMADTRDTGGF